MPRNTPWNRTEPEELTHLDVGRELCHEPPSVRNRAATATIASISTRRCSIKIHIVTVLRKCSLRIERLEHLARWGQEEDLRVGPDRRQYVDESRKEPAGRWVVAAKLILTIGPFALLLALYALFRWAS